MKESKNHAYHFVSGPCATKYLARSFEVSRVSLDELMRRHVLHRFCCCHCPSATRELS